MTVVKPARNASRIAPQWPVVLLSFLSLLAAAGLAVFLQPWEDLTADWLMRVRYRVTPDPSHQIHPDVAILSIDDTSVPRYGRFGAGKWISREAYSEHLLFFARYLRPSVLGYDIVFQENTGEDRGGETARSDRLGRIYEGLTRLRENPKSVLDEETVFDMNTFALEEGNVKMTHLLAAIAEEKRFPVMMASVFHRQTTQAHVAPIPAWTDEDVFGGDPSGDESKGKTLPYIKDIAIPASDIHFSGADARSRFPYTVNATLPSVSFLDYTLPGAINGQPDADGVMRRVPLVIGIRYVNSVTRQEKDVFIPSFSLLACLLHLGLSFPLPDRAVEVAFGKEIVIHSPRRGDFRIPIDDQGRLYLDYVGRFTDFNTVSYVKATVSPGLPRAELERRVSEGVARLNGRIVMVGLNLPSTDVGSCPLEARTPLVSVHLTAVSSILSQKFIAPLGSRERGILWGLLFAAFTLLAVGEKTYRLGPLAALFGVVCVILAFLGVYWHRTILPCIGPLAYVVLAALGILSYRFLTEGKARRTIRRMFTTMVSDEVLTYLEENPDSFSVQGHDVEATVLFSDIANFTGISEHLPSEKLTELLHLYLTPATDAILNHGGYLDKYLGDGIMAVWGAPNPDPDHAFKACLSALQLQKTVRGLNERIRDDFGFEFGVRVGINSGVVKAGNMGSDRRFQYTVIGDAVNLASRLESVNKDYGTRVIIGPSTERLVRDRLVLRAMGRVVVVGKETPVEIYEVVGEKGSVEGRILDRIGRYERALGLFYQREWKECLELLEGLLREGPDGPAAWLKRRAEEFQAHPPPAGWQGEYVRTEK